MQSVVALLNRVAAYGPIGVGADFMNCSNAVPQELKDELSDRFWDARAVLQEWQCVVAADSPIVKAVESLLAKPRKHKRKRNTQKQTRLF